MRVCRICGLEKDISCFHKSAKGVGGYDSRCAECKNKAKRLRDASIEGIAANRRYRQTDSYKASAERKLEKARRATEKQRRLNVEKFGGVYVTYAQAVERGMLKFNEGYECKNGHVSERLVSNRACLECTKISRASTEYKKKRSESYFKNREYILAKNVERQRRRYQVCEEYKAAIACRNMLKRVLARASTTKNKTTYSAIGYSAHDLIEEMKAKFTDGMSWSNYGKWHIYHIKPVSAFIKEGVTDQAVINALSNLQPLWAEDNFKKRDSYPLDNI